MKKSILLMSLMTFLLASFVKTTSPNSLENRNYKLKTLQHYHRSQKFEMNDEESRLSIQNNYAILNFNCRQNFYFTSGAVANVLEKEIDGKTMKVFTIIGDNKYTNSTMGKRTFIAIDSVENKVIMLNKVKLPEYIFEIE